MKQQQQCQYYHPPHHHNHSFHHHELCGKKGGKDIGNMFSCLENGWTLPEKPIEVLGHRSENVKTREMPLLRLSD